MFIIWYYVTVKKKQYFGIAAVQYAPFRAHCMSLTRWLKCKRVARDLTLG